MIEAQIKREMKLCHQKESPVLRPLADADLTVHLC